MRGILSILAVLLLVTSAISAPPAVENAAKDSTVLVKSIRQKGCAYGSAAYIGNDMFITNHHVIEGAKSITIAIPMTAILHDVKVVAVNAKADVAILISKNPVKRIKAVKFAIVTPRLTPIYAAGYGSSLHDKHAGEFLRVYGGGLPRFNLKNKNWYRFAGDGGCSISGDSGGPAFNEKGEYIGPIWGTDKVNTYAVRSAVILGMLATLGF